MQKEKSSERLFIAGIMAIFAYEWLVSGIDKLRSNNFVMSFHQQLVNTIPKMQYAFYGKWLERYCLPHAMAFAFLVEFGELFVGISFFILAIYMYRNVNTTSIAMLGCLTGLVAAFMTINFFLYQGGAFFINVSDPFDEGIPIDLMMSCIQIFMVLYFGRQFRVARRQQAACSKSNKPVVAQSLS